MRANMPIPRFSTAAARRFIVVAASNWLDTIVRPTTGISTLLGSVRLTRPRAAFRQKSHALGPREIARLDSFHPESGLLDHASDRPVQMASAADAAPKRIDRL